MRKITHTTMLALGFALPGQVSAQSTDEPVLEEIVITADRPDSFGAGLVQVGTFRNARIIDVPLTVNVVPQELLRSQAVTGLYEALRNTAGVTRSQLGGTTYDNIAVRGILVENRTSYRLNGSMPIINLVDLPLENKDRVEVLKGVGALYYGFAPPSGIVNLVTERPDRDLTEFTMSGTNHGAFNGTVDVSRRISDRFGIRFNGGAGVVENGIRRFDGERYVAALAADWDASDAVRFKLDVEHVAKDVTEPSALQLLPADSGFVPDIPDPETNFGGRDLRYDAWATNVLGRVDWRISSGWALTVEGGQAGWRVAVQRAAPHLRMLAMKDFYWDRGRDGRWRVVDCPLGEGMVDWKTYLAEVRAAKFAGPISLHVEYETGGRTPVEKRDNMLVAMQRDRARLATLIEASAAAPAREER